MRSFGLILVTAESSQAWSVKELFRWYAIRIFSSVWWYSSSFHAYEPQTNEWMSCFCIRRMAAGVCDILKTLSKWIRIDVRVPFWTWLVEVKSPKQNRSKRPKNVIYKSIPTKFPTLAHWFFHQAKFSQIFWKEKLGHCTQKTRWLGWVHGWCSCIGSQSKARSWMVSRSWSMKGSLQSTI